MPTEKSEFLNNEKSISGYFCLFSTIINIINNKAATINPSTIRTLAYPIVLLLVKSQEIILKWISYGQYYLLFMHGLL